MKNIAFRLFSQDGGVRINSESARKSNVPAHTSAKNWRIGELVSSFDILEACASVMEACASKTKPLSSEKL
jgi:hypothetical protein